MITLFGLAALPLNSAGKYVAAAYIVAALALIIYVAIMAKRLIGNQREILELRKLIEEREQESQAATAAAPPTGPAQSDASATQEPVA
jgi:hypothetical protein